MAKLRVTIERSKCAGDGICVATAPGVFDLDEEGIAMVIDPEGASHEIILQAATSCPTDAITVIDEGTGRQIAP